MNLKDILQKNKSSVVFSAFAAFWILVIILFYFFIYQWQEQEIASLENTINAEKGKTLKIETFIDNYPDISKYEQEIQNKIDILNLKLPNNDGMAEFLIVLENTAKKTGVKISNIKPSPPINKDNIAEYNVELAINGSYFQLLDFLKSMEEISRFNIINTVAVQGRDQLLNVRVIFSIFQYGNTKSADGVATVLEDKNKSDILTAPRVNKPQAGVST